MEIGFCIVPERRRRRYASEAAQGVVDWAICQPGIRSVVARCDPASEASIGTLERLGFTRTAAADSCIAWRLDGTRGESG